MSRNFPSKKKKTVSNISKTPKNKKGVLSQFLPQKNRGKHKKILKFYHITLVSNKLDAVAFVNELDSNLSFATSLTSRFLYVQIKWKPTYFKVQAHITRLQTVQMANNKAVVH